MVKKEYLLELYKEMNDSIQESSVREWEIMKFYTTIFLAFLTATITLITYSKLQTGSYPIYFICILPIFMFIISCIGLRNFTRECHRLWERVASLAKIEGALGFRKRRPQVRPVFKDDKYYLPNSHINIDIKIKGKKTTENFVKQLLKLNSPLRREYGTSYSNHATLFWSYIIISVILVILALVGI